MEVNLIAFSSIRGLCIIYVHVHSFPTLWNEWISKRR